MNKFASSPVYKLCSLPEGMKSPAIIQNPCKEYEDETLILGAEGMVSIYIYNHTTNRFTKNEYDDLTTILIKKGERRLEINTVYAFKGSKKETSIIVLGTAYDSDGYIGSQYYPFYSVFDSKSLAFEEVGSKMLNNSKIDSSNQMKNKKSIYNTNIVSFADCYRNTENNPLLPYLPFWNQNSQFNKYKNYLLFTHTQILGIYDISDEYNPRLIMYASTIQGMSVSSYGHGTVILPCYNYNYNDSDEQKNINSNVIKLLGFGGHGLNLPFLQTFFEYEINFNQLELKLKAKKDDINIITHIDEFLSIVKENDIDTLSKLLNFEGLKKEAEKKKFKLNKAYGIKACDLYNSRYLIIYDIFNQSSMRGLNSVINYDFEKKKWTIVKYVWPIDKGLSSRSGAILWSKEKGFWLQIMGGMIYPNRTGKQGPAKKHFGITLCPRMDWSIERLLWMGYLKNNEKDDTCRLATLPKEIILLILKFVKCNRDFIFDDS